MIQGLGWGAVMPRALDGAGIWVKQLGMVAVDNSGLSTLAPPHV